MELIKLKILDDRSILNQRMLAETEVGLPRAIDARDAAETSDENLAAENQISTILLTIKDLRCGLDSRERHEACPPS